jgi:hypothetical protein
MLYREIIGFFSRIQMKLVNTLCGQNVELLNVNLVVHIVTTDREIFNRFCSLLLISVT